MSQQWYDPSSKWLLEEQGASLLYLAGARSVASCRARQAEVVQPRKLPDGILEARFADSDEPRLILVEVATYPEKRVVDQMCDNLRLVRQARGVLVDAVVICLCPRGTYRVPDRTEDTSALGWSGEALRWKVVELWTLSAEDLLTAPEVAGVTMATLARYDGPPEVLLQRCRDRIEREGGGQRANLLAVSQVFARMHFDTPELLDILGGSNLMIESPWLQEIADKSDRKARVETILRYLTIRFGAVTTSITAELTQVKELDGLLRLTDRSAECVSLEAFEQQLRDELPKPRPASTRGKRRPKKSEES
jgi:hypothetical protein